MVHGTLSQPLVDQELGLNLVVVVMFLYKSQVVAVEQELMITLTVVLVAVVEQLLLNTLMFLV